MNNMPTYGQANSFIPYVTPPMSSFSYPNNTLRTIIPGRSVSSVDEITPGEVPMDGSLSIFPKNDGSAIYVKSFNSDGTINTKTFIPAPDDYVESPDEPAKMISNQDIMQSISDLTDQINDMKHTIDSRNNYRNKKNGNQSNQKEGNENA